MNRPLFWVLRAALVASHAHCAGFHVAATDDEHRADAQLSALEIFALNGVALKSVSTQTWSGASQSGKLPA